MACCTNSRRASCTTPNSSAPEARHNRPHRTRPLGNRRGASLYAPRSARGTRATPSPTIAPAARPEPAQHGQRHGYGTARPHRPSRARGGTYRDREPFTRSRTTTTYGTAGRRPYGEAPPAGGWPRARQGGRSAGATARGRLAPPRTSRRVPPPRAATSRRPRSTGGRGHRCRHRGPRRRRGSPGRPLARRRR